VSHASHPLRSTATLLRIAGASLALAIPAVGDDARIEAADGAEPGPGPTGGPLPSFVMEAFRHAMRCTTAPITSVVAADADRFFPYSATGPDQQLTSEAMAQVIDILSGPRTAAEDTPCLARFEIAWEFLVEGDAPLIVVFDPHCGLVEFRRAGETATTRIQPWRVPVSARPGTP
jgi:hypothetical protein